MKYLFIFVFMFNFSARSQSKEAYRKTIREHMADFNSCFKISKIKKKISKTIVMAWQLDDTGTVRSAKVKRSTFNNVVFEKCVVEKLSAIGFPPAPGGQLINIVYPIEFEP